MRLRSIALFTLCACTVLRLGLGQQPAPAKDLSGNWILSADLFGNTVYLRMELKQDGEKLSGKYTDDKVTMGTVSRDAIHLLASSDDGSTSDGNFTIPFRSFPTKPVQNLSSSGCSTGSPLTSWRRVLPLLHTERRREES